MARSRTGSPPIVFFYATQRRSRNKDHFRAYGNSGPNARYIKIKAAKKEMKESKEEREERKEGKGKRKEKKDAEDIRFGTYRKECNIKKG